ncbi:MAG: Flp family type IVb pilin [Rhizobiales bacterium]|nr:Flp family type IVb pilin [Hyphomicrobiales bacterium]
MRCFIPSIQIRGFLLAQEGATAIEYALIASGVSIAILGAVTTVGSTMMTIYYDKLLNLF